jgi:hypothetical protein
MLIPPHRRRSSTFSSAGGATGRRRGESISSTVDESADTVKNQEGDQDESDQEEQQGGETRSYPVRLHGRGGFGHARGMSGGSGRGISTATTPSKPATVTPSSDPMDSLTAGMSALKFIPHSVRAARGRGRGRGG